MLELTMSGFEMKSCRNDLVSACSGTISSAQVLVYSTGKFKERERIYKNE